MARRSKRGPWWLLLLFLIPGLASAKDLPGLGDDDDDDDDDDPKRVPGEPTGPDKPDPKRVPGEPTEPDKPDPIRTGPRGPAPSEIDDWIRTYPTPATFYQVKFGDTFTGNQGIATRLGLSALHMAAVQHGGLTVAQANAFAAERTAIDDGGYNRVRRPVTRWIACVPFNDARFGTYAFNKEKTIPGPQGRGIRLLPMNARDADRIRAGEPAVRNVRMGQPGSPPSVSAGGVIKSYNSLELLWLPMFDLEKLWLSQGAVWEPGGEWPDGSSQISPPPRMVELGIIDYSDSGVGVWGCAPFTAPVPEGE